MRPDSDWLLLRASPSDSFTTALIGERVSPIAMLSVHIVLLIFRFGVPESAPKGLALLGREKKEGEAETKAEEEAKVDVQSKEKWKGKGKRKKEDKAEYEGQSSRKATGTRSKLRVHNDVPMLIVLELNRVLSCSMMNESEERWYIDALPVTPSHKPAKRKPPAQHRDMWMGVANVLPTHNIPTLTVASLHTQQHAGPSPESFFIETGQPDYSDVSRGKTNSKHTEPSRHTWRTSSAVFVLAISPEVVPVVAA